jgi:hypothetical protein
MFLVDTAEDADPADSENRVVFGLCDPEDVIEPGQDVVGALPPTPTKGYTILQNMDAQDVYFLAHMRPHAVAFIPDDEELEELTQTEYRPLFESDDAPDLTALVGDEDEETDEATAAGPAPEAAEDEADGPDEPDAETIAAYAAHTLVCWGFAPGDLHPEAIDAYLSGDYQTCRYLLESGAPTATQV